jgi:autotransporter-associated beta strand protein
LQIQKDVVVGGSATLALAGNASLSQQTAAGAIVMSGGTFRLDNSATNNPNRLRDGDASSTGLDSAGGGVFEVIGAFGGTTEIMSRLQLGSPSNARSGALTIRVTQPAATVVPTQLMFQSLSRDGFAPTFSTVNFTATDPLGTEFPLGQLGFPRISFITPPVLANGLLRNTRNINPATVGWATVNGSAFATHGPNGIAPVELDPTPTGDTAGDPTANIEIRGSFVATNSGGYAANSIRFEPTADGQSFAINTSGNLQTHGILLAGPRDFTISGMTGGFTGSAAGAIAAAGRYVHVESATLTISAPVNTGFVTLVKAGEGTLVLTNPSNVNSFSTTVLNAGSLRATPNISLPTGELRFRGGVLEITGGGTFSRGIGSGPGFVNWAGVDEFGSPADEDEGSGGFAAVGMDATTDLAGAGPTVIPWESDNFINSGHALMFGSKNADRRITWSDHLYLGELSGIPNYNAREIRVTDNLASSTDLARFTGIISGTSQNDLLKTGDGTLELVGSNSYLGATLIHEGTLLVNAPGTTGTSFLTEVRDGATLGGNGTVGPVKVASGGDLAPGSSVTNAGILATGSVNFDGPGAQFSIEIGGPAPGTGFDQLAVTGSVALNGANLAGSLSNGFLPEIDQLFFLIVNDGTEPVSGTFAQGATVTFSGIPFQIGYAANSQTNSFNGGNDVVVRAVPEPAAALLSGAALMLLLSQRRRRMPRRESAS